MKSQYDRDSEKTQDFTRLTIKGKTADDKDCAAYWYIRLSLCKTCSCPHGLIFYETKSEMVVPTRNDAEKKKTEAQCTDWYLSAITFAGNFFADYRMAAMKAKMKACSVKVPHV